MEIKQWSHSRVECFNSCPLKFRYRYIDKLETLPPDDAANPLIIGKAMHTAIESGTDAGLEEYYKAYNVITDLQINEAIKIAALAPRVRDALPDQLRFEVKIDFDSFIGFIDAIHDVDDHAVDLYDFKYSNNIDHYLESPQLSLYKYYYEKMTGKRVRALYYVMIPKVMIRQKKTENLDQFRRRLMGELSDKKPQIIEVEYQPDAVNNFVLNVGSILLMDYEEFMPHESRLCDFCEYKEMCRKGERYMILPKNERREITKDTRKKIWLYGAPFSGKTTFADKAPNPISLNTDGNIEYVTMPYIPIRDTVKTEGRRTVRTFAWEVFKEALTELEKKENDFETIVVDLLEDTREACRVYEYDHLGIEHESDSGYGKGWDIVKTEYLSTMRRLFNLNYKNIIVISHEVVSEIKKSNGATITKVAPNLPENIANKIAGMVDIVARVVVDDEGGRWLNFKSNEYIFGGGRLSGLDTKEIPLDWDALMGVFERTAGKVVNRPSETRKPAEQPANASEGHAEAQTNTQTAEEQTKPAPRRTRKHREEAPAEPTSAEVEPVPEETPPQPVEEEAPRRRRRRTRE